MADRKTVRNAEYYFCFQFILKLELSLPIKYTQAISLSRSSDRSNLLLFSFAAILLLLLQSECDRADEMRRNFLFFFRFKWQHTATVNRKYRTKRRGKLNDVKEIFFFFRSMIETNSMWNKTHLHSMWPNETNDVYKTSQQVYEKIYI